MKKHITAVNDAGNPVCVLPTCFNVPAVVSFAVRQYRYVGCFRDNSTKRAIRYIRPTFRRESALSRCASFATSYGYRAFGVQSGKEKGYCFIASDAHLTYEVYGQVNDNECKDGLGEYSKLNSIYLLGRWTLMLYRMDTRVETPFALKY